jgi:hypothetical protein
MDNFTPLKINNKPKINKLLVFVNLFLVVLLIGLPVFYLSNQNRKIITNEKAAVTSKPTGIPTPTATPTIIPTKLLTITPTGAPIIATPTEASTSAPTLAPNLTVTPHP